MGKSESVKAVLLGILCFLGMSVLFTFILHYPVRAQKYVATEIKSKGRNPMEIEAEIKNPEAIYEEHFRRVEKLPKFHPPADNHVTEDQIHRYYKVVDHCWQRITEFKQTYIGSITSPMGKLIMLNGYATTMLELCKIEGFDLAQMDENQFFWVRDRMFEAALFALNRKLSAGQLTEKEKAKLKRTREEICNVLGLVEDKNPPVYHWEQLDLKKLPRHNVKLFLRLKDEVRYRYLDFTKLEFDEQDIMKAAQDLPE